MYVYRCSTLCVRQGSCEKKEIRFTFIIGNVCVDLYLSPVRDVDSNQGRGEHYNSCVVHGS